MGNRSNYQLMTHPCWKLEKYFKVCVIPTKSLVTQFYDANGQRDMRIEKHQKKSSKRKRLICLEYDYNWDPNTNTDNIYLIKLTFFIKWWPWEAGGRYAVAVCHSQVNHSYLYYQLLRQQLNLLSYSTKTMQNQTFVSTLQNFFL